MVFLYPRFEVHPKLFGQRPHLFDVGRGDGIGSFVVRYVSHVGMVSVLSILVTFRSTTWCLQSTSNKLSLTAKSMWPWGRQTQISACRRTFAIWKSTTPLLASSCLKRCAFATCSKAAISAGRSRARDAKLSTMILVRESTDFM